MIKNKTVLGLIPARGGSKGIPRKNIREVAGKPLIAWTIEEAKKSKYIDKLILSSDDAEIITVAREWGCEVPFVRPAKLAQDDTPGIEPVIHAIQSLPSYDYVVLLQPTSPLRKVEDIDGCIELCVRSPASACASVANTDKSPFWMYTVDDDMVMHKFIETDRLISCRQDLPIIYALNGAIYVIECSLLLRQRTFITENTIAFVMDRQSSVDIDTEADIVMAEALIKYRG